MCVCVCVCVFYENNIKTFIIYPVNINAVKTQCCLISRRVDKNLPNISFDSNSLEFNDKISMLGVTLGSDLSWNDHISTTAKASARKLGLLFRYRRYYTPSSLLTQYKAQIRPCLEYGSHVWRGASKHSFATLNAIQKREFFFFFFNKIECKKGRTRMMQPL